jgi:hypothetical protein
MLQSSGKSSFEQMPSKRAGRIGRVARAEKSTIAARARITRKVVAAKARFDRAIVKATAMQRIA